MRKQLTLIISILIFCFIITPAYSQKSNDDYALTPQVILKAQKEEAQYSEKKKNENIRASYNFYELYAAQAIKNEDMSICDQAGDRTAVQSCVEHANFIFTVTNLAAVNCDLLQEPFKGLCNGLSNGCATTKNNREMCEAFKNNDINGITKASNAPTWAFAPGAGIISTDNARHTLAIYSGSKSNSADACEKFVGNNSVRRNACKILFSNRMSLAGFNRMIDNLINQYKTSEVSKK